MSRGIDIGVRLCYLLYAQKITPDAIVNIAYELSHASTLFRYLCDNGNDINTVAKLISCVGRCDDKK
jgi:hypothetical protein